MHTRDFQKKKIVFVIIFIVLFLFNVSVSGVYGITNDFRAIEQNNSNYVPNQVEVTSKPSISLLNSISPLNMYFNDDTGYRDAEITPWSLENNKLGGNFLYLVTTFDTFLCDTSSNIFQLSDLTKITSCKLRQSSAITPNSFDSGPERQKALWSRDYYGAFSGHIINSTSGGWQLYLVNHGELLNNDYFAQQPCRQAPDIGYGTFPCTPENRDKSYNGFIGMSTFNFTKENYYSTNLFNDQGPIIWPSNGYVENNKKATYQGIVIPTSIIKDNYLYVFYRDSSQGTEEGRKAGLKVARAPITNNGIDPHSFKTYFNGSFSDNALPSGFDKNNVMQFFSQKGGRSTALFSNDITSSYVPDVFSFSVAKIKGTNWYLGVAQDLRLGVTLRISQDLVNWSKQTIVPGTEFDYFSPNSETSNFVKQPFMYTRLANSNGDSNVEIDPNDFYIIGNTKGINPYNGNIANIINKVHAKLNNLPSSSPSADFDNDGKLTINDFNVFVKYYSQGDLRVDFNSDGKINIADFVVFEGEYAISNLINRK